MTKSLQDWFVENKGSPIKMGAHTVSQLARIPISEGKITLQILSPPNADQGVCLKAKGGYIELPDGSRAERLHVWHDPGLPAQVSYRVFCPSKELLVWNIYRIHHFTGETTEDEWTGDAGMVLEREEPNWRRYSCSDWRSPFDPSAISFEIAWNDC